MLSKIDLTDAFATEVAVVGASGEIEYANKKWNDWSAWRIGSSQAVELL